MIAQKNVSHLFYATSALATTALPTTAYGIGVRRIGESLCDASALVAGDQFQVIMMDANGKIKESPMYTWSNLITKNKTALSALVSQVSSIGYNGTDGDIVATNLGNYLVTIGFRDMLKQIGGKRLYKFAEYQAGATAKNYDVAIALAGSLDTNMRRDAFKRIVPKAICSFGQVNGDCFDDDVYVVKGSKYLTFKTSSVYSTGEQIVVGDYVRLGAAGVAPTVTSPVYRVTAVDLTSTDTVTLDRPVTNDTGTYVEGTFDATVIRKADAEGATNKWGLVLTGNDADAPYTPGMFGPNLIMFTVGVSPDFSTTEVRLTTTPAFGQSTYKQLAQLDWELQANNKEAYRIAEWLVPTAANIQSSDTITFTRVLTFKDNSTDVLGNVAESYMTLIIASDTTADANLDTVFTQ